MVLGTEISVRFKLHMHVDDFPLCLPESSKHTKCFIQFISAEKSSTPVLMSETTCVCMKSNKTMNAIGPKIKLQQLDGCCGGSSVPLTCEGIS